MAGCGNCTNGQGWQVNSRLVAEFYLVDGMGEERNRGTCHFFYTRRKMRTAAVVRLQRGCEGGSMRNILRLRGSRGLRHCSQATYTDRIELLLIFCNTITGGTIAGSPNALERRGFG